LQAHIHLMHGLGEWIVEVQAFRAGIPLHLSESSENSAMSSFYSTETAARKAQKQTNGENCSKHCQTPDMERPVKR
jgi:hypothetical protein